MLQLTSQQKLLLAVEPIDFRAGIDRLASICKAKLELDPFSGIGFAFTNRKRNAVKTLMYDGKGFYMCLRRFSNGKLAWWPTTSKDVLNIQAEAMQVLLGQGDPRFMYTPMPWLKLSQQDCQAQADI